MVDVILQLPCVQAGLRHACALGADTAIHIHEDRALEPLVVAQLLAALTRREQPGLLLLGKQSIDGDHNQTVRHPDGRRTSLVHLGHI